MLEIKRPVQKPVVVIRTATGYELSEYEKNKLANIEDNAQENIIEIIKVNGHRLQVDPITKSVNIELEHDAFINAIKPDHITTDELFHIKCDLDEV